MTRKVAGLWLGHGLMLVLGLAPAARASDAPAPLQGATEVAPATAEAVRALIALGEHAKAEAAARALLGRAEADHGTDSTFVAQALDVLVEELVEAGRANEPEAKLLAERSLAIREKALGPDHVDVSTSLNVLARVLQETGDLKAARPLFERALSIDEKALGPDHADVATSLNNLASLLNDMGELAAARLLFERCLAITEKAQGPESPDVATSLGNLGLLFQDMGDFAAARPLQERALAISEKALGPDHVEVAQRLNNLAVLFLHTGNFRAARPLLERSLAIKEKVLGPDHPDIATGLNNLGSVLEHLGDLAATRPLYERSRAILEKTLGPEHPIYGASLNNLAFLYSLMGDYASARPLFEQALAIREKARGPDHPDVASSLNNLAMVLYDMGDDASALPLYERALAIREKALGPDHPRVATSLLNLASVRQRAGDLQAARPLYERALAIQEKALGPDHPEVATSLNNLGTVHWATGDLARARPLYERALAIREKALGPDHSHVADSLGNLATLLTAAGDFAAARLRAERAASIKEKALGPRHPEVAASLNRLAGVLAAQGDVPGASAAALRAEGVGREHARLMVRTLAEHQALRLAAARPSGLDVALSVAPRGGAAGAFDELIRSRALVLDEMTARYGVPASVAERDLADRLRSASQRLANLTVRGPGRDTPEQYRELLDEASHDKEQAERELAETSASFREEQARSRVGLEEVAQSLLPGDGLVAYCRYLRHVVGTGATPPAAPSPPPKAVASYLAFVLLAGEKEPAVVPIGTVAEIDTLVTSWRAETLRPGGAEHAARGAGDALRSRAWDPVAVRLGEARRVFVVPDGALNLVSFAALPVGTEQYLVETGPTLHALSAERDLVPGTETSKRGTGLLAFGGPAFDETALFAKLAPVAPPEPSLVATVASLAPGPFRGSHSTCGSFATLRFAALEGAAREAGEVTRLWRQAGEASVHLEGAAATEAAFKARAPAARVVHLATHGFFLGGECRSALGTTRGLRELEAASDRMPPALAGENPLLLSGLALAGANHRDAAGPDEDDGILTAEEIASLDLSGVEWAVLSACDTGLGNIEAGEGVFGLRRAFQVAGARSVVMSLWAVDDEATRRWMRELYRARLERKQDTAACVREASLAVLNSRRAKGESTHPVYWAGFVAAGDWR